MILFCVNKKHKTFKSRCNVINAILSATAGTYAFTSLAQFAQKYATNFLCFALFLPLCALVRQHRPARYWHPAVVFAGVVPNAHNADILIERHLIACRPDRIVHKRAGRAL